MLAKRILVIILLLPIAVAAIYLGGWWFTGVVALILGLAAWEYVRLFSAGGLQPAGWLVILGTVLFVLARALDGFDSADWMVSLAVLSAMTVHLIAFERGRKQAATDFGVTLGGVFYLGWIGAYLISLRMLPEGEWWVLLATQLFGWLILSPIWWEARLAGIR